MQLEQNLPRLHKPGGTSDKAAASGPVSRSGEEGSEKD